VVELVETTDRCDLGKLDHRRMTGVISTGSVTAA
jgi:hypothetical protein